MIILKVEHRLQPPAGAEDWFAQHEDLVARVAAGLGGREMAVELTLVDDAAMADLNSRWRGSEGCTDVLSFSDLEEGSEEPRLVKGQNHAAADLELPGPLPEVSGGEPMVVGELIIAPHFVKERCLAKGWSVEAEFPLLVVHGLLHILGWEHDTEQKRQAMQDVEESILTGLGLTHPLRQRS